MREAARSPGESELMEASPTQSGQEPTHVLVVSNETVGGHRLLDAIEQRAARGPIRVTVVCPRDTPRQGFVVYDDTARSAARVRLDLTLDRLRELGIPAHGEVMDPDPYMATQDAIREWGADEVIVSTYPYPRVGMLRRDLIERIRNWSGLPVEHVVVDLREEPLRHVLVVASQTVGGPKLIESLERRSTSSPHRFTVIAPQSEAEDGAAATQERLDETLRELRKAGLKVNGYVAHPDPLTAIRNAFRTHPADEIVISTLPQTKSRWLRGDLINQAQRVTGRPVEHLVFDPEAERQPAGAGAA
jgi:nucleotide-binding universal stress UspA family protein